MTSQLCLRNLRQNASMYDFHGAQRTQKTAKNSSSRVFGRQGPEVRILSPRPILSREQSVASAAQMPAAERYAPRQPAEELVQAALDAGRTDKLTAIILQLEPS